MAHQEIQIPYTTITTIQCHFTQMMATSCFPYSYWENKLLKQDIIFETGL